MGGEEISIDAKADSMAQLWDMARLISRMRLDAMLAEAERAMYREEHSRRTVSDTALLRACLTIRSAVMVGR